MAMVNEMTCFD